ncbi:cysteine proteinase 3 [Heterostelium album PN500]|uniref:Cysteine proteinase 3 n=1 Tax=Heterostelium pallidum (strain ATCC 26659 / Pp 5 / PN500) TaxID=670386 RepID=D3BL12_HETP5|nr:cysteine proteinase 3 [Heterostelium album PN500]EFA78592.1 cysteine proteinase 3 [Heterostelium album PN500]|eukprot:XP_020430716.1 cysteine proteinase 3 [Heterostelium album PN500]
MRILLALFLIVGIASANRLFSEQHYQNQFTNWMVRLDRAYDVFEFQDRYNAFKNNLDLIHKWNSQGHSTVLGVNHLADLSNEEYRNLYLGVKVDASRLPQQAASIKLNKVFAPVAASLDWRSSGAVGRVKDQGQCGSCWSFSTTGSIEGANQIATGNFASLSEQQLMDCSRDYGNEGCNGGLMDAAMKYVIAQGGLDTEESYPYTMSDSYTCKFNPANIGAKISSYIDVQRGSETDLAAKLNKGPVSVAIDASHSSFQLYKSGVYYEPACSSYNLDHGVLAVGYGTEGSSNYWIVKNSWGPNWGLSGYIWMAKDKSNHCGISSMASIPVV